MLDVQHLAVLREIQRSGGVTAAAERLHVTQSALSHMIRNIENRHGVKIWSKQGRSLRFTQAGNYLLALAERILPQMEHAERVLAELAAGRRGVLRVGMECHPCERWLMRLTPDYLAAWPDVDLDVRMDHRFDGVASLANHDIDLLVTPDPVESSDLLFTPVASYELVLVVHNDHPLSGRTWLTPQDLQDQVIVTVPVAVERLDIFTRFLLPQHCRPLRHNTVSSTDLMLQLVAAKRAVAVLPDWLVREEGERLPVQSLRLGKSGIQKSLNLGVRRGEEDTPYISGFIELARTVKI